MRLAANYVNFKADLGPCNIYCLIIDRSEWRFLTVDFQSRPFSVKRAAQEPHITAREGSFAFLVDLKNGKLVYAPLS